MSKLETALNYRELPAFFYKDVGPEDFENPKIAALNNPLGKSLGLPADWLRSETGQGVLSGRFAMGGGPALAMAYGGHQFGHWSGLLGDGRARLVGDPIAGDGRRYELHLKGAGRTPFSRGGDGKATLGSAIREYIICEAMAALGVPTTRALSLMTTGETIMRNGPEPGAVFCRSGRSHIRVGTFQIAAASGDLENVRSLANFTIERLYPDAPTDGAPRYQYFLRQVIARQVTLICQWMGFGFIHGVMNTDNACVSGETIDYGPCAFMDDFHPGKVFSSIDRNGRYAWNRQPEIAHWNMARLAETLLPLLGDTEDVQQAIAEEELGRFSSLFATEFNRTMERKFGLGEGALVRSDFLEASFEAMTLGEVDFTLFFRQLTLVANGGDHQEFLALFSGEALGKEWLQSWKSISANQDGLSARTIENMQKSNPIYIPRNHRVEEAIAAANVGEFGVFRDLLDVVTNPFSDRSDRAGYENPPELSEVVHKTFCGT